MDRQKSIELIGNTFNYPFDEGRFRNFAINLLNDVDENKAVKFRGHIKHSFMPHIKAYRRLGTYTDPDGEKIDVLVVQLKNEWALERSRTMLRNFTSDYLKNRDEKDAALVAYYTTNPDDWRFSFIRMEYKRVKEGDKYKIKQDITPAKRYSFLVGKNEPNHTAQAQLVGILADVRKNPTLSDLETAFSVDAVTKQFYKDYRAQFEKLWNELNDIVAKDSKIGEEFETKTIDTANFAKKLMGQIVFIYFLQKKGWLGVTKDENGNFKEWGTGPKNFLRRLFDKEFTDYDNFFNEILEPLFYEALATERPNDVFSRFNCKIPFLNGGLFEPINDYNWEETDIRIDNDLIGDVFKTFDQYNFTVREDEPLEKEVAVDPEMLGKVFENLLPENLRKGKGAYYTPRTIVHYMCQESIINYLDTEINKSNVSFQTIGEGQLDSLGNEQTIGQLDIQSENRDRPIVPKEDIETLIREGDKVLEYENKRFEKFAKNKDYKGKYSEPAISVAVEKNAQTLDDALANIKVCDPAIGSGAFPVGMLSEIVKARKVLELYLDKKHGVYELKRHCIQNSLYGVDIDPGAIEIAKLRLWLSLVVDEDDYTTIQPLPNLDYKIMQGNSLIEEFNGISLDIKKKEGEQFDAFTGGSDLDTLITDLHQKQDDFFNAEHPREKKKKRDAVESSIYNIFHNELEKIKNISPQEAQAIETDLKEMTHGNKERNFFPWKLYFADVFREKDGFDVVIANPPYFGEKHNINVFKSVKESNLGNRFYQRRMDYFYFFFHSGFDLLKENGLLSFITTNYYPTATAAYNLRLDMKQRSSFVSIINFNELRIFESAQGQHNMISIFIKNPNYEKVKIMCSKQKGIINSDYLRRFFNGHDENTDYLLLNRDQIFEGDKNYIRVSNRSIESLKYADIFTKLQNNNLTLCSYFYISQGLITGTDKVTEKHIKEELITAKYLEAGVFVLSQDEIKNLHLTTDENRLLKPYYKNSDIQQYTTTSKALKYVLYLTRDLDIDNYPNIKKHILIYENVIKSRSYNNGEIQAGLKLGKWWVVSKAKKAVSFESDKIVVPQRANKNVFGFNSSPWYAGSDVYFLCPISNQINIKYALAILNSRLYYYWLYYKGKRKGEILELLQKPLSEIPIKKVSEKEQQPFINNVDCILSITKVNYLQNPKKQAKVKVLEAKIDQLVYELYGLTEAEIKIVEESVK